MTSTRIRRPPKKKRSERRSKLNNMLNGKLNWSAAKIKRERLHVTDS